MELYEVLCGGRRPRRPWTMDALGLCLGTSRAGGGAGLHTEP